jgi:glutamate receptor, ionotropic, invertebrate
VNEPPTYAPFEIPKTGMFNGAAFMKFEADIHAVTIRNGASVNTKSLGTWTAGLTSELKINAVDDMKNLTAKVVYRIYTVVQAPFIIKDENTPKGFKGYCIDLIDEIAKNVDFDYDIKEVEDGKFGNMNEKGEWNGIVRKLIDKQADIGLGSMSVMAERETVIDFTVPYYDLVGELKI